MSASQLSLLLVAHDWELLKDDWNLRLHLLSHELAEEFQPKLNAIYGGKKRSDGHYVRARIELEIKQADYTAKRYFDACCELWENQCRPKSRTFFLAVLHNVLVPSFDLRFSFTSNDIRHRYPNETDLSLVLGHFKRELDKVRSRWATQVELASRAAEYAWLKFEREAGKDQKVPVQTSQGNGSPIVNKRSPRPRELCHQGAAEIVKKNPSIELLRFCTEMDRKAEQTHQSPKYLPPRGWRVRSFHAQYLKRANTVSRFLSTVKKTLRDESGF